MSTNKWRATMESRKEVKVDPGAHDKVCLVGGIDSASIGPTKVLNGILMVGRLGIFVET